MKLDILIKNGHVIDPLQNIDEIMDIGVINNKIVNVTSDNENDKCIDAEGCYVFPGLIDFHTHVFNGGTAVSVNPNYLLPTGVTATVDAGTSGCCNYESFYHSVISNCQVRIKSYLNVYGSGQMDYNISEVFKAEEYRPKQIAKVVDAHKDNILGLKIRMSKGITYGIEALEETIRIARELEIGVCVHVTNPACSLEKIADLLAKDDIFCHMYQGTGEDTILDDCGQIKQAFIEARKRGVVFDAANGRGNFTFDVALPAMKKDFMPDIISTDWLEDKYNYSPHAKSLPYVMSKYIEFGMPLVEVIRAVTETPARIMNMSGKVGTLKVGAYADISIFKMIDKNIKHQDFKGNIFESNKLLIPQMTISNGEFAFCQGDFALV